MSNTVHDLVRELERTGFYGTLELKYEGGRLAIARKTETIKLDSRSSQDYRDNRGSNVCNSK